MREDCVMLLLCFLLLVCLPNHLLVASPSSSFSCHHDQRHSLLRFKDSFPITGPRVASWREDEDCCSWDGVTCDNSTGDVIGLDLTWAGLQGFINSSSPVFSLRHLQSLNLAGNDFLGSAVPPEIGVFTRLEYLNLSSSVMSGILPTEISQLSNLVSLDLSMLPGFEMQDHTMRMLIQNLTRMEELDLEYVDMSTLSPISFMNISSSLISLNLFHCSLGGKFPEFIFGLPNLRNIELSENYNLAGTLPKYKWSPRLDYMSLGGCPFTSAVPNSIGNLSRLAYLDLAFNNFSGEIPYSIGNLSRLTYLELSRNNFTGAIPYSIGNLSQLTYLDLSGNNFVGLAISGEDANHEFSLSKLQELYMQNCNLSEFPSFLSHSKELIIPELSGNKIQDIPNWLWSIGIDTLWGLDLNNNLLMGSIPQSVCQLASLTSIYLYGNKLTGVIPQCIGNVTNLDYLDLSNNSLSGSIPQSICHLTSLSTLGLNQNKLTGVIPQCLGNLMDLVNLDLSNNSLSGPLPPSLANCTSLEFLDVSYNRIGGAPPTWVCTISIKNINLRANNFAGRWPSDIFLRSVSLNYIDLSDSKLEGPLPLPSYAITSYLVFNNHFTGNIPSLICNATGFGILDLSNNSLTGTLPDCLENVTTTLYYLNLRANEFRSQIPEIFCKGCSLTSLDLSRNQFDGPLPRSLSNCKQLEALDVGNNNIVDSFPNWLGDLPLKVLSLRSNDFHGHVIISKGTRNFSKVRIFDLSKNNFEGHISDKFMGKLLDMTRDDIYDFDGQYMIPNDGTGGYYSVMIDLKGIETEMVKINVQFTMLGLSSNRFQGEVSKGIGLLKSLKGLNFSHNRFKGTIPATIGNLTNLESLDLSSNSLMGEIPNELVKLTFLEFLDLSRNNLTGPIPLGGHFNTFPYSSFEGNPGLCGIPLTRLCGQGHKEAQPPPEGKDDGEDGGGWLEWEYVAMGFGSGMGLGISLGYMVLEIGRPVWLVRLVLPFITR